MSRALTTGERRELVQNGRCTVCLADWMADPHFLCDCHASRDANAGERAARLEELRRSQCEAALEAGATPACACGAHVPVPFTEIRAGHPARSGLDWVRRADFERVPTFTDEEVLS